MRAIGTPPQLADGTVVPLSPAVSAGDIVCLSGQLALRNGAIVGADIETQTHIVLDTIAEILSDEGLTLSDVFKTTIWLADASDFSGFNRAYAERMQSPYPARSTVVCQLLVKGALVEIEATARHRA